MHAQLGHPLAVREAEIAQDVVGFAGRPFRRRGAGAVVAAAGGGLAVWL
ncbi:hypothetical protein [Sphingomonas sp. Y38-1Y]